MNVDRVFCQLKANWVNYFVQGRPKILMPPFVQRNPNGRKTEPIIFSPQYNLSQAEAHLCGLGHEIFQFVGTKQKQPQNYNLC